MVHEQLGVFLIGRNVPRSLKHLMGFCEKFMENFTVRSVGGTRLACGLKTHIGYIRGRHSSVWTSESELELSTLLVYDLPFNKFFTVNPLCAQVSPPE